MAAIGLSLGLRQRPAGPAFDVRATLPAGVSLARGSPAVRVDSSGRIATELAGAARFDHDPVTLVPRGLLVEDQATNRLLWSDQFATSAWSRIGGTSVTADAATAPDGSAGADLVTQTAAETGILQDVTVAAGSVVVQSLYLKAGSAGIVRVRDSGDNHDMVVNLATGTIQSASAVTVQSCTAAGGGWYRCVIGYVAQGTTVTCNPRATGAGAFLVWGAQVEIGGGATSYIATGGAAAARAADAVTIDWRARGVPEGAATVRYTFDDGTTQSVATTILGGTATVPVTLARPRILRAAVV